MNEELEQYGITAAQLDVLIALNGSGPLEQQDLQEALGVSSPTIARMLTTMEDELLVHREQSSDDARRKVVSITDEGSELLRTLEKQKEQEFTEQFLDGFNHTDAARLNWMLNTIADNMGDTSGDIFR